MTLGGWSVLSGAKAVLIGYIAIYLVMAYYVVALESRRAPRRRRAGDRPAIFAAVAGAGVVRPRQDRLQEPAIDAGVLGLVTRIIMPVQILLIAFAMRGFQQAWNVEVERSPGSGGGRPSTTPQPA